MSETAPRPDASAAPRRSVVCPLCGGPNGCVPAACGSFNVACWCTTVRFTPELVARARATGADPACICRRCATGSAG